MLLSLEKQIYPPITSAGLAAVGSVFDNRFGKGDASPKTDRSLRQTVRSR